MDVQIHHGDVSGFRSSALQLLGHQVHPAAVAWSASAPLVGRVAEGGHAGRVTRLAASVVPRSFLRITDLALLHTDPQRFDLLYRLLWRIVHEPRLKDDRGDYDMQRVSRMASAVRRDLVGLKTSVAFQPVEHEGGTLACGWAAPQFYTTEAFALWVARSRPDGDFVVASPERCVLSRRRVIHHLPPMASAPRSADEWLRAVVH
jgi:DNA polymerase